jgi:putative flippase GtrA
MTEFRRRFAYFLGAGAFGFIIDVIVFFGMSVGADVSYVWSRVIASAIAMTSTWLVNRSLAFSDSRTVSRYRELLRYLMASVVGALSNLFVLSVVARYDEFLFHVPGYIAGATVGLAVNYLLYKYFVFTGQPDVRLKQSASKEFD